MFYQSIVLDSGQGEQRIIVLGDGNFLSSTYPGNVGNLDMELRIINGLIHGDRFIVIPAKITINKSLQLSRTVVVNRYKLVYLA